MQHINFPLVGNSIIMAIVILVHVFFAFVAVGGICLAFASEWIGYRKNSEFHDRFARGYIGFLSDMMKMNGVLGVAIVVLLIGLFPAFSTRLYNIFFWPLILEIALFMAMMVSTVVYANTWKTAKSKGLHIAVGGLSALFAIAAGLVINAAHAFMLTPGKYFEDPNLFAAVFNPSMSVSGTHLVIPCIVNAAMFAYIYSLAKLRKAEGADAGYYSWLADYSGTIFAYGILLQPLSGLSFLFTLKGINPAIFDSIVTGPVSWFFWRMAALAAVAVASALVFLISRKKQRTVLLVGGLAALTAFSFGGYTRERARKPYLIYGNMYMSEAFQASVKKTPAAVPETVPSPVKPATAKPGAKPPAAKPAAHREDIEHALEERGCTACHVFEGEGGTFGPVLDGPLKKLSRAELKNVLKNPAATMPPFDGTEAELDAFVNAIKSE